MNMFSSLFSGAKKERELVLIFDIGSSSVGAALCELNGDKVPKIIFSTREYIMLSEQVEFENLLGVITKALDTAANKVAVSGKGVPNRVFATLSSLWYISQTRHISYKKSTDFTFTSKLAEELVQKEISLFENEYLKQYNDSGHKMRAIEIKTIRTSLNGYQTSNPVGQKAHELDMTIFISMSQEAILQQFEEHINHFFHGKKVIFVSFVVAMFSVVRDMYIHQENFLLFDISAEVTDISMVKNNILRESISFPMGRNFVLRGVANSLGCTITEAQSIMSLYNEGHADQGVITKLEPVLVKIRGEWLKKFQESLASISNDISIPATIFLTVSKEFAGFFSGIIQNEQFNQYTLTESKFSMIFLDTKNLHRVATFEENIARDPFLILESVYVNRFLR